MLPPAALASPSGLSKFAGGMLGAAFSPRLMLALGLMATSVINITFGFTTGVAWWTALWALNGGLQVRLGLTALACYCKLFQGEPEHPFGDWMRCLGWD
jgi:sugar phosphate permease